MGQKVHPIGFRLGVIKTWDSKWFEHKNYAQWLHEDIRIREFVKKSLGHAGVSKVEIERAANKVKVNVHTARPGIVIGKRGAGIETVKKDLQKFTKNEVFLNIVEVRKAEIQQDDVGRVGSDGSRPGRHALHRVARAAQTFLQRDGDRRIVLDQQQP